MSTYVDGIDESTMRFRNTSPSSTILEFLHRHAENQPDRVVYRFLRENQADEVLTFGKLERRVLGLAAALAEHAVPGERALLLYPPGLAFVEAFLACLAAGIVAVPAYPPKKNRSADRLQAIARDCDPRLLLTDRKTAPLIEASRLGANGVLPCLATDAIAAEANARWQGPALSPESVAFLQYTSGSTGTPKGVIVNHRKIVSNMEMVRSSFGHSPDTVMVCWLPVFHDMGLFSGVLQPLCVGFPSIFLAPIAFVQEPVRWLEAITKYRATSSGGPNFAYDHCVRAISEDQKKNLDLSSWGVAYNGAEPIQAATMHRFAETFARCGFRPTCFFPCYGLAESTILVAGGPPARAPVQLQVDGAMLESRGAGEASASSRPNSGVLVSSGRPAAGVNVVIVDPESLSECPAAMVGEVWVASESVAKGYWNRPDETQETFGAYLAGSGEGPFLRTGDLGIVRDGELFVTGRLKDLIIVGGRNLYPQDIEAVVQQATGFVEANGCAAFGLEENGAERLIVVAEADRDLVRTVRAADKERVTGLNGAVTALEKLVNGLRKAVVEEFEVPLHTIAFVRPGTFPRTSSGKVQRQACKQGLLSGSLELVHLCRQSDKLAKDPAVDEPVERRRDENRMEQKSMQSKGPSSSFRRHVEAKLLEALRKSDVVLDVFDGETSFSSMGVDSVAAATIVLELDPALEGCRSGVHGRQAWRPFAQRRDQLLLAGLPRSLPAPAGLAGGAVGPR